MVTVRPVIRPLSPPDRRRREIEAVVHLLFEGPTANETATAATELPRLTDAPRVVVADGILFVQLPGKKAPLSRRAMLQLTCTVNHAEADGGTAPRSAMFGNLYVLGDGWTMTQSDHPCPVASPSQEKPEALTPWEPSPPADHRTAPARHRNRPSGHGRPPDRAVATTATLPPREPPNDLSPRCDTAFAGPDDDTAGPLRRGTDCSVTLSTAVNKAS